VSTTEATPISARFVDVAVPVPLDRAFTYAVPEDPAVRAALQPGVRVTVPWGRRRLTGVVMALCAEAPPALAPAQLKPIADVLDAAPVVDAHVLALVAWAASYYQAPIGELARCALPPGSATTGLRPPRPQPAGLWHARPRVERLNSSQQRALADIVGDGSPAAPLLLHGVTGSGKTAVYLAAIEETLARGAGALLLVPEIGLTPALFADFTAAFPEQVAVLHSGLGVAERARHWRRLRLGEARVAIGTRSAVFASLPNLGLILVDEEHDASFKQQESPRYHGRDLAVMRAKLSGARIVLGSATPSLESYAHARAGKYRLAVMAERVERRPLPAIRIVDMGAEFRRRAPEPRRRQREAAELFSEDLRAALADRLERGQQSLLLLNRRGFAPAALCRACGEMASCRDCSLALTFHKRAARMLCHFCGFTAAPPTACAQCGSEHIYFTGAGSERAEEELAALFPKARIARLDRDTARSRRHFEQVLANFRAGDVDILVGTQMIAKGHDVPGVTLVGVLQADLGLAFPDFRAAERTFQLLTQVAGRAGRGREPGEVILQAHHPEHYAVAAAAAGDFAGFYEREAEFRRWLHYPPFAALAWAQLRHADYDRVLDYAARCGQFLRQLAPDHPRTKMLGPAPALLARAKREHRMQFVFKSESRRELHRLLAALRRFAEAEKLPATALIVDVDPLNL
jgi:primosomal protein N' (replication factor Y)